MVSASSITAFALVLVCAACGSVGSPQDQYKARESGRKDRLHPAAAAALAQATDQMSQTPHHFAPAQSEQSESVLDVAKTSNSRRERHKSAARENRFKRNTPWSGNVPGVYDFSRYQPQTHQISRPYFIPVYVQRPGITIFGPPQPILNNPGYPQHNKPGPQNGYLPPPATPATESNLVDKIDEDSPEIYWDVVEAPAIVGDSGNRGNSLGNAFNTQTTRKPPANRPTRPNIPLDRTPGDGSIPPNFSGNGINSRPIGSSNLRPNTVGGGGGGGSSSSNSNSAGRVPPRTPQTEVQPPRPSNMQRPTQQPPTTTTAAPEGDRRCVWAILSCCVPGNMEIKESCFETRGCSGPFWGNNPCSPIFTQSVLNAAMNYFE